MKVISLLLCLVLLYVPVPPIASGVYYYAAATAVAGNDITRISANSAQTTNVNFSTAPTAGDLIVVYAHRDGSNTPPTKVAGYTTIDNTTGANTNSAILAFKFSDGTETGTGTWTNATSVATIIYRNAGLGGWAKTRSAGTTSPMTYGTLTMANTGGTSWVAGFGAAKASTDVGTNAPSGMTVRSSTTDVACFDTGAGVSAWSAQTAAINGTPGGTVSYTLEILAVPSGQLLFTFIQHATALGVGSATTAAVTIGQSVGSEPHILVISAQYVANPVDVVSIDKGGTLIPVVGTRGGDAVFGGGASQGYVIGTTTATTPITVTFAGTTGGCNVGIWEVAYTGTGTPSLDCATRSYVISGTSVAGAALTMTGGNDVVFHTSTTDHSNTAVSAPYNAPTGYSVVPSGNGWAAAFNNTTLTTPTWTINIDGRSVFSALAFGLNPTAFTTRGFSDFEGSSDGTSCTEALLKAGMHGWMVGKWTTNGTALKFASAATKALANSTGRLNNGETVASGAGSLGVEYLTSTNQSYLKWDFDASVSGTANAQNPNAFSAGVWFWSDVAATNTESMDVFNINAPSGNNFCNALYHGNGTNRYFRLEVHGADVGGTATINPSQWYWLSLKYVRTGDHILKIYDDTLTLIDTITATHDGSGMPGYIVIGESDSSANTTGKKVRFDSLIVDPEGSYPLLP